MALPIVVVFTNGEKVWSYTLRKSTLPQDLGELKKIEIGVYKIIGNISTSDKVIGYNLFKLNRKYPFVSDKLIRYNNFTYWHLW